MKKQSVYIGSFHKGERAPLIKAHFDAEKGELQIKKRLETVRPSWLCLNSPKNRLFFVLESDSIDGEYGGGIAALPLSGEGEKIISKSINAKGPCHILEANGRLFISCYGEGALVMAEWLGDDFSEKVKIIRHSGSSIDPVRQARPHPHFSLLTKDGKYLAVCDLGLDKIFLYPYSKEQGLVCEPRVFPAPAGSGPRHGVFSPDGRFLYVVTEMGGQVLTYNYSDEGNLSFIGEVSVLDQREVDAGPQCAAIRLNPQGTELMVTERRSGSVVFFSLSENGVLHREGLVRAESIPRDAVFSPDGKWLLVANQGADSVSVYSYSDDLSVPLPERVLLKSCAELPKDSSPCSILFT